MSSVEIHGRIPRWPTIRLALLLTWAALTGYLAGHDRRDWNLSWQSTRVVLTDPATGMTQTQEQSGAVESLTTPDPNAGKAYNLFSGHPDEQ